MADWTKSDRRLVPVGVRGAPGYLRLIPAVPLPWMWNRLVGRRRAGRVAAGPCDRCGFEGCSGSRSARRRSDIGGGGEFWYGFSRPGARDAAARHAGAVQLVMASAFR